MKDFLPLIAFCVALFVAGLFLQIISLHSMNDALKDAAIERGYALHCPVDGEWHWKGECE